MIVAAKPHLRRWVVSDLLHTVLQKHVCYNTIMSRHGMSFSSNMARGNSTKLCFHTNQCEVPTFRPGPQPGNDQRGLKFLYKDVNFGEIVKKHNFSEFWLEHGVLCDQIVDLPGSSGLLGNQFCPGRHPKRTLRPPKRFEYFGL